MRLRPSSAARDDVLVDKVPWQQKWAVDRIITLSTARFLVHFACDKPDLHRVLCTPLTDHLIAIGFTAEPHP